MTRALIMARADRDSARMELEHLRAVNQALITEPFDKAEAEELNNG